MSNRVASLVFFYFGEESYINRLAQETVPLRLALIGYDRAVLLHHETAAGPFKVSKPDEKHADVVDLPTKEKLVEHLNALGAAGYAVDLYVFSHGWPRTFRASNGTYGDNGSVGAAYLEQHVKPGTLRAVWQCNCYGASLNETWRKLGAIVSAGAIAVNFYPTRFKRFMAEWTGPTPFAESLERADAASGYKTPVQLFMMADAGARLKEWNGSVIEAPTVLGRSAAAERYFRQCWGLDWVEGKNGKENMAWSSKMLVDGDGGLLRG